MKKLIALLLALATVAGFAGCTPKEPAAPAAAVTPVELTQGFKNTWDTLTANKTFTLVIDGVQTTYEEDRKYLYYGPHDDFAAELDFSVDAQNKKLSAYGYVISDGELSTYMIHDGWNGFYDWHDARFYKKDVSQKVEKFLTEPSLEALMDEQELEDLDEDMDLEKAKTLWAETVGKKLSDAQWLKDNCGYTTVVEGNTVIHSFQPDLEAILKEFAADLEEAYEEEAYKELTKQIKDIDNETTTKLTFTQTDNMITGMDLEILVPEDEVTNKTAISIRIENIGTAQVDEAMQTEILDKLKEYTDTSGYLGRTKDEVYTNKYLGIKADLSADWEIATEEEVEELMGYSSYVTYYVEPALYAINTDGKSTLNIMVEPSNGTTKTMTEENYTKYCIKSIEYSMKAAGFKQIKVTSETIQFAGEERTVIRVNATYSGKAIHESIVMLRTDEYVYTLTIGTDSKETADQLLAVFEKIEEQ